MPKLFHVREMGKFEVFNDAVEGAHREKLGEASEEWVAERIIKAKQEVDKSNYLHNMFERLSDKLVKDVNDNLQAKINDFNSLKIHNQLKEIKYELQVINTKLKPRRFFWNRN